MRKVVLVLVLVLAPLTGLFGMGVIGDMLHATFNMTSYSSGDFSGHARADYLSNEAVDIDEKMSELDSVMLEQDVSIVKVDKIKKVTKWLIQQALNEYDYRNGEYYMVLVSDGPIGIITSFVTIDDNEPKLLRTYRIEFDLDPIFE